MKIASVPLATVWEMRKSVMYPSHTIEMVQLANDAGGVHLGIWENENCISVISLFINNKQLQIRKFATQEVWQKKGYGTKLLQYCFDWAEKQKLERIWCNARVNAKGFYTKFGMEEYGETWVENGFEFVKMQKVLTCK